MNHASQVLIDPIRLVRMVNQIPQLLGNSLGIIYPQRWGRSLTEPLRRPKVSSIVGDLRSVVSARSGDLRRT